MARETETLLLTFVVDIEPEQVAEFRESVGELVRTAGREPGVLQYDVGEQLGQPHRFMFVERYVDQQALEEHQATPACTAFVAGLPRWLARPSSAVVQSAPEVAVIALEADEAES